jgi:hypothetical protein
MVPCAIYAQTGDQGRIVGRVVDTNGAVVPGATIVVKNNRTGEERTVTSSDEGYYQAPALRPSSYTVSANASNFATTTVTEVLLAVGQELNLELKLSAAGVATSVDIYEMAAGLETNSAALSATVNQREVVGLPLNGRQLSQLYLQAPGSVNSGSGTFGDIRFSGRAVQQNVVRYDGIEGTAIIDASPGNINGEVPSPFRLQSSLENVQEFRVDSNNFPAEYGTGTGGQVSVVTKSGSNGFHGSLFEFFRNDALDAPNFFDNIIGQKSSLRLNQFGGSLGGPIIKDKAFFFFSYEGYRLRAGINSIEQAPGLASRICAAPFGSGTVACNANIVPLIPAFRDPNAVVIRAGTGADLFDVLQLQSTARVDENAVAFRFDYRFSEKQSMYFRFFRDQGTNDQPEGVTGRRVAVTAVPQNGVVSLQSVIKPTLLNEFKFGYNAATTRINGVAPIVNGIDLSLLSINITGSVASFAIPGQGTSAGTASPGGLVRANSATNGRAQPYTPYSLSFIDNLTWISGNHSFKFGGEFRALRLYTDRLGGTTFTYSNIQGFLSNTPQSIQFLGDLSAPSPFNDGATGQRLAKQEYYIGYAQDEWKIRQNLTLNFGLRYEYYTPLKEDRNLQVLFDMKTGTLRNPTEAAFKSSKNNFGPRVALTWSPNPKSEGFFGGGRTVLRGGFGIYYGPGQTEDQIQPIESDRVSSTFTTNPIFSGGPPLAFPFNTSAAVAFFENNPNTRAYQPRAYSSDYEIPEKIYQYSVSVQQQLPYNMVATFGYVGSQGRNLFLRSVANQILPGSTVIANGTPLPSGVGVINRTDAAGRVIAVNTVRQFSIVSGTSSVQNPFAEVDYKTSGGSDSYNALQTTLTRRFNDGLVLNAQYTFGRSYGNTAGSNEARTSAQLDNFEADRGYNNFDIRHTFNISAIYALPFGKGKRFDMGSIGNALFGNMEIGGIVNARSGLPIEVLVVRPDVVIQCTNPAAGCTAGEVRALPSTINAATPLPAGFIAVINTPGGGASRNVRRPDLLPGVNPYLNDDRNILNPAAFAIPAPGQFGNLPRNALRGPSFRQFDMILNKKFNVTETKFIEFRAEFFNIFNTANFANPGATLNNSLGVGTNLIQPGQPFTQASAGGTFGLLRQTVERTVGLGTNRQIQFGLRFSF